MASDLEKVYLLLFINLHFRLILHVDKHCHCFRQSWIKFTSDADLATFNLGHIFVAKGCDLKSDQVETEGVIIELEAHTFVFETPIKQGQIIHQLNVVTSTQCLTIDFNYQIVQTMLLEVEEILFVVAL